MFTKIQQIHIALPADIVSKIYEIKNNSKAVKLRSNVNGWQSKQYTSLVEIPWVEEFLTECLTALNLSEYKLKHLWFNINPKGAYHTWHAHGGTSEVGVCYVSVPRNSGNIEFEVNKEKYAIKPTAGMLVTFPAGLNHRVLTNESDEDRISMAFNLYTKS